MYVHMNNHVLLLTAGGLHSEVSDVEEKRDGGRSVGTYCILSLLAPAVLYRRILSEAVKFRSVLK